MGKRARAFQLKYATVLNTCVFETLGQPPDQVEFRYKDLRRWGYDLLKGSRDGQPAHFLAEVEDKRQAGAQYDDEGVHFEVEQVLTELPADTRLWGNIQMADGQAWLALRLEGKVEEAHLWEVPAAELLVYYLAKESLFRVLGALRNVGLLTELVISQGDTGKARPYEELPPTFRRMVKEARKLEREFGVGRLAVSYFGEAKDRRPRYRVSWVLPTIALFAQDWVERIDRLLGELP